MIGSFVKWYRCSFDFALYRLSYANIILYGRVIPSFDTGDKDGKDKGDGTGKNEETVSADNPEDWKKIKQFYRRKKKKH